MPGLAQQLAGTDAEFLKKAAEGGHAEIQASQIAARKAQSPDVKTFASQMVSDHTQNGQELKRVAAAKGVSLPTEPSKAQAAKIRALEGADGDAFDKAYAANFGLQAHEDMRQVMMRGAQSKDADVKAYADKTLPAVEHHLEALVGRRHPADPLLYALGGMMLLHVLDAFASARLEFNTVFGYTATIGIRLAGLGNAGAFLAPAIARHLAGVSADDEKAWFAAHDPARQSRAPVAEIVAGAA